MSRNIRQFLFTEGNSAGQINFPYQGEYTYGVFEQTQGSGNLNPALAYNKVETGMAIVLPQSAQTTNDFYDEYISPNEDNSNIIFAPGELNP